MFVQEKSVCETNLTLHYNNNLLVRNQKSQQLITSAVPLIEKIIYKIVGD